MGWGNKQQRANKLVNKHLSPTIRDKVVDKAHDYAEIKTWLIEHYGDPLRIVNDTITALAKKKKPSPGSAKDRYKFYSEIVVSILRLERLTKEKIIDTVQLNDCLHSKNIFGDQLESNIFSEGLVSYPKHALVYIYLTTKEI